MPEQSQQQVYLGGEVALWGQRQCGDPLEFLGCQNLTGVSTPRGEANAVYCRIGKNTFKVIRTWRATAGLGSLTLVAHVQVVNWAAEMPCPFNLYALYSACDADEDPNNWDFLFMYVGVEPTSDEIDTVVVGMSPDDQTEVILSLPCSFKERLKVKRLNYAQRTVAATTLDFESIAACDSLVCGDLCGDQSYGCQALLISTAAEGATPATIYKSTNGGVAFADLTTPFTDSDQGIPEIVCAGDLYIALNDTDTRYAYSWTGGLSWTEVLTPDHLMNDVFILSPGKIWFCGQDGYIWFSADLGATAGVQDAGDATGQSLNAIAFADSLRGYAVGRNNAFVRTVDGGVVWTTGTGPAVAIFPNDLYDVVAVPDTQIVIASDEQGNMYRSENGGVSWSTIFTAVAETAGGIPSIALCDCNVFAFIANDEDPYFYSGATVDGVMYLTINGGATWMQITVPANDGLLKIICCDINTYWITGVDGMAFKVSGPTI